MSFDSCGVTTGGHNAFAELFRQSPRVTTKLANTDSQPLVALGTSLFIRAGEDDNVDMGLMIDVSVQLTFLCCLLSST